MVTQRKFARWGNVFTCYVLCLVFSAFCTSCFLVTNPLLHKTEISLDFIEDGKTTKEAAILKLGASFAALDGERILSYRLGKTKEGYLVLDRIPNSNIPGGPSWLGGLEGKFNLILVFNKSEVLQKHSLVPIN